MRLTITNTAVNREAVRTAFRRTHDVRVRARSQSIVLLMDGKTCPEIAQWLSREEETSRRWVQALNPGGLPGLERAPILGRPTCLSTAPLAQVQEAVRPSPRAAGSNLRVWPTTLGRHCIYIPMFKGVWR